MSVRPRFSQRVPSRLEPSRLAAARARLGPPAFDLTVTNPTAVGIPYPPRLLAPLADPRGLTYDPDPRGDRQARRALAATPAVSGGARLDPDRLLLVPSTSDAYGLLLRVLCDPDSAVLAPTPSYPLLPPLARLEAVRLEPMPLVWDEGWRIQPGALPDDPGLRAAITVNPNNPTGHLLHAADRELLVAWARQGRALIADEVFLPFIFDDRPARSLADEDRVLTFTLGGLSKSCGLPQLKLAWISVSGPGKVVDEAIARLEWAADAYLTVAGPTMAALDEILELGGGIRDAIRRRCRANLDAAREIVGEHPALTLGLPAGGWTALIRFPAVVDEDQLCLDLLTERGVAVHPGYLFDLPIAGWVVVSLLPREEIFAAGLRRVTERIATLVETSPGTAGPRGRQR